MPIADVDASHPRLEGFSAFYESDLAPFLAEQERARKAALSRLIRTGAIVVPVAAVALALPWFLGVYPDGAIGAFATFLGIVVALAVLAWAGMDLAAVSRNVKHELMTRICTFLGFTYNAEPQAAELGWYRDLGLVPGFDRKSLEDEIAGGHNSVSFSLCEAHLEDRRTRRDSDGRTETYYVTVFRGLLARFTFPKAFAGRTVLKSDGGFLGNLFGGIGKKGERVRLEDPRFEKLFEVFSDDQVEARYLLTPTFMERVTELAGHVGGKLQLAFDRDRLLLTVNGGGDRFESGSGFSSFDDPEAVARIASEIAIVFRIIDALRLDAVTRT